MEKKLNKKKNILFTGVTSFSGFHFVNELSKLKKINIYCTLQYKKNEYKDLKLQRLNLIKHKVNLIEKTSLGSKNFIKLIKKIKFDYFCHHSAYTKNYNNDKKFDLKFAIQSSLKNIDQIFEFLPKDIKIILTETIFQNDYAKSKKAFNKYGLYKSIVSSCYDYYCSKNKIQLKKIVIPNPWGILEERRFLYYLINKWLKNETPFIKNPNYIRDNIYIDDLSKNYKKYLFSNVMKTYYPSKIACSNYVFAQAIKKKLEFFLKKKLSLKKNMKEVFIEPKILINAKNYKRKIFIKKDLSKYFKYYTK